MLAVGYMRRLIVRMILVVSIFCMCCQKQESLCQLANLSKLTGVTANC